MKTIIVTRHAGAIEWIKKHHQEFLECEVITHVSEEEIKGNIVIGTLPIPLAFLASEYWHLSMNIPSEARGTEITCEKMEEFGCKIEYFIISKL